MSRRNFTPKSDRNQLPLPGLLMYDPRPGIWRVAVLNIIHGWRHLEQFAWQRLDELAGDMR